MTFREKPINKLYAFALAALFALTLAGCGGGGGGTTATPDSEPPPMPTAYEQAVAAIAAAETAEAAQAAYDAVDQAAITGAESQKLQAALDDKLDMLATAMRAADQKKALSTAAGEIDTSDLSTQEAVDAARTAIAGLRQALADAEDVSDEDKAMYMSQLDDAVAAVDEAQGGIDTDERRTNQTAALTSASGTLQAALAALSGSTPTQAQLDAATAALAALNMAIADGADLTDAEKAAYVREAANAAAPIQTAQAAFDKAKDAADDQMKKDMAASGKALHKALTTDPLDFLDDDVAVSLAASGLMVNPNGTADDTDGLASVPLKASGSAGSLDGWSGMNYAHMDSGTKVANSAVVYTNQGAPTTETFASEYGTGGDSVTEGTYTPDNRRLAIDVSATANSKKMKSSRFPTVGSQNFPPAQSGGSEVSFSGTYDGASGTYLCTTANAANGCAATYTPTGGITLTGTWIFTHAVGAMVSRADGDYLYFGWWLRKDKDDMPTHASAFSGVAGTVAAPTVSYTTLAGSATYVGKAVGKFALSNPLDGTGNAGHFTADATLTAKFGANEAPTNGGVTGVIENFMANGASVPWSVKLNRAAWGDTGSFAPADDATTTTVDESVTAGTVWSIDGNAAPASGIWSGQMYDEKARDGSDVPTTAIGTFQSEFSSIGRMVGAFGANKQ